MKSSSEKSTKSTSTTATPAVADRPFFEKAGGGQFFEPTKNNSVPSVQMKLAVNQPGDKFEQEADRMADRVVKMPSPMTPDLKMSSSTSIGMAQRTAMKEDKGGMAMKEEKVQRKESNGSTGMSAKAQSSIQNSAGGGQPLGADARSYMEPRFGADFSNIRVHSDPDAASISNQLSAKAFTYQNHIFFSRDQYQPGTSEGKQLLAHELTHTIQQGHAPQQSADVSTTTTPPQVQRFGLQDALDYFADKAYHIPGFRMLTIVLGFNPINMRSTDRSAANILRALIELVPGGHFISQALDNHGVFTKAGAWVEQKLAALGDIGSDLSNALDRFMDSLSWSDILDLGGVWERAKQIFTAPISNLINFALGVVSEILTMVKDAILKPLATMAQGTRGYDLLKAVLGRDPITGEVVPRNADTLIGGFMKLIGQEEVWENIKKGNAIGRAWAWFQGALSGLMGMVLAIPGRIINTITSLTFQDIITVVGAFGKIVGAFVNIANDFISWGLNQVISLLEIIFSVVAPGAVPYITKARAAFVTIIKNPIAFIGNLVRAGKLGFQMFAGRIMEHLKTALIKWITGPLGDAGVYIPKSFSLIEIIKLVLSVLGLTWQNIRTKLVKIIPEPVLVGLEKTAGILVTLVKDGPVAAWEQIKAELSELKDQMVTQITQMISMEVVKAAVTKLVSMLNPAGAVIQAILAIYNTITFFIEKINQIAAVVGSFIDSIAAIANGQVMPAAKKVEQTMANTLTVIIAFLAKFVGLGNVPNKLVAIIKKIRQPIDRGLEKIVAWLGNLLKKIGDKAKAAFNWLFAKKSFKDPEGNAHSLYVDNAGGKPSLKVASTPMPVEAYLSMLKRTKGADFTTKNSGKLAIIDASIGKAKGLTDNIEKKKESNPSDPALAGLQTQLSNEIDNIAKNFSQLTGLGGKTQMIPAVVVNFDVGGYDAKEFKRQIDMQEVRINSLTITNWLVNRHIFVTQGRTGDAAKSKAKKDHVAAAVDKLYNQVPEAIEVTAIKKTGITGEKDVKIRLEGIVKGDLSGQAVLHTLDQVAGGSGDEFGDGANIFGNSRINSSIGPQWTSSERLGKVEKAVAEVSPDVYPKEKMKVDLHP